MKERKRGPFYETPCIHAGCMRFIVGFRLKVLGNWTYVSITRMSAHGGDIFAHFTQVT